MKDWHVIVDTKDIRKQSCLSGLTKHLSNHHIILILMVSYITKLQSEQRKTLEVKQKHQVIYLFYVRPLFRSCGRCANQFDSIRARYLQKDL